MPDFLWHPWGLLKTQAGNLFRFLFLFLYFFFLCWGRSRIFLYIFILLFSTVTSFLMLLCYVEKEKKEKELRNWGKEIDEISYNRNFFVFFVYSVRNLCFYGLVFLGNNNEVFFMYLDIMVITMMLIDFCCCLYVIIVEAGHKDNYIINEESALFCSTWIKYNFDVK